MKKLFSVFTLLILGGLYSSEVWGYDLYVGGVQVMSTNASNITGSTISGKVTYDDATKTLTLNNAFINRDTGNGIVSYIEGLTILVHGNSAITTRAHGMYLASRTTIKSDIFSVLNITSQGDDFCGIWITGGNSLSIESIWMNIMAALPLKGDGSGSLHLKNCYVNANGKSRPSCVQGFEAIRTIGVKYDYGNVFYNTATKCMEDLSGNVVSSHKMMPRISVGTYIWDVRDNAEITTSTPGTCLTSGTITFDAKTRTLTMNNVNMSPGSFAGINYLAAFSGGTLNIKVVGNNTITHSEYSGAIGIHSIGYGVNIYGNGADNSTLTINNTKAKGIYIEEARDSTLSISNLSLNVTSKEAGSIYGDNTAKLVIDGCAVNASYGIYGFSDCTLLNCHPSITDMHFSKSLKGFTTDDKNITYGEVKLAPGYDLLVCNKRVTNANKDDILGDGQFSYDPKTNTLTLEFAEVTTEGTCIFNSLDNLTIKLIGPASLTSTGGPCIYSTKSLTITSDSFSDLKLNSTSSKNYPALWLDSNGSLTFDRVWVEATGTYGLYGTPAKSPSLYLRYCNVYAKANGDYSCVVGFGKITTFSVTYNYDNFDYDTTLKRMVNSKGEIAKSHTMKPRIAVRKFIFNLDENVTISRSTEGAGISAGKITYDKNTHTLNLENTYIEAEDYSAITYYGPSGMQEKLTINVKGNNVITNSTNCMTSAIYCNGNDLTIKGSGKQNSNLSINIKNAPAVNIKGNNTLAIKDVELVTAGSIDYYSLYGSSTASLSIDNSHLSLCYSLNAFKDLKMTACDIVEPTGAFFSPGKGTLITDALSIVRGRVEIDSREYLFTIGETRVTTDNATDILGDGQFSYDISTKTLTLTNANLENLDGSQGSGISYFETYGLNIIIEGACNIATRTEAILSESDVKIIGNGILKATSSQYAPLSFAGKCKNCYISGPTLILNGKKAIADYNKSVNLYVYGKKTYLSLSSTEADAPTVYNLKKMELEGDQRIAKPEKAFFSQMINSITVDGENAYSGKVVICDGNIADVNRDTSVDVADVAAIIDSMAGTAGFNTEVYADVNADGSIDVADIATVIDVMAAQ